MVAISPNSAALIEPPAGWATLNTPPAWADPRHVADLGVMGSIRDAKHERERQRRPWYDGHAPETGKDRGPLRAVVRGYVAEWKAGVNFLLKNRPVTDGDEDDD